MDRPVELSVIVPCFNEALNLPELARRTLAVFERGEIAGELVLVDDSSRDETADVIRGLEAAHPGVVVGVFHEVNRGIAHAWRSGLAASSGRCAAIMDADLQYQPEDLLRLHRTLVETSVDVVQGWRSPVGRTRDRRYWISRGFNHLLNKTFGMDLSDNKSGFVCCTREVMDDLLTYDGDYRYFQSFIMVAAHAKGYEYREVETLFEDRRQGVSFLEGSKTFSVAAESFLDLAKAAVEYRVKAPPRDIAAQFLRRHPVDAPPPPSVHTHPVRWRSYMRTFEATHWMITHQVEQHYLTLNETQWLDGAALGELQDEKLRRLVRHAWRNVPFYRQRMREAGLRPEDVRGREDLHKLPFLSKDDVRENLYFDIMAENVDKNDVLRITTSGSTGRPFVCYADREQLEFRWAATLRAQEWTGYAFGDPSVRLWHQTLGMTKEQAFKERADAIMSNRVYVPIFEMKEDGLASMMRTIEAKRPVLVDGYAEAFDFLARHLTEHGGLSHAPKAVMSSAQSLPQHSREVIERAFGCRVFDKYGSREFSGIAYECGAHAGHHVVSEGYIVEILVDGRPAAPGETGEVVITDLNNYAMPFIRYRIGDLAVAMADEPCACGRGAPRMGEIHGRVQSIIRGTDGRYVPGTFFPHLLKDYEYAIERFQIVQDAPGAITFRMVEGGRFSEDVLEEVLGVIRKHLGDDLSVDVEKVDKVAMVRTGKRMTSISHLDIDFQADAPERSVVVGAVEGG
ncbi:MAG: glycosyltransferase [Myxococcales bacterium]|nr:glycosyltransferase [Myxococcales bacterium]